MPSRLQFLYLFTFQISGPPTVSLRRIFILAPKNTPDLWAHGEGLALWGLIGQRCAGRFCAMRLGLMEATTMAVRGSTIVLTTAYGWLRHHRWSRSHKTRYGSIWPKTSWTGFAQQPLSTTRVHGIVVAVVEAWRCQDGEAKAVSILYAEVAKGTTPPELVGMVEDMSMLLFWLGRGRFVTRGAGDVATWWDIADDLATQSKKEEEEVSEVGGGGRRPNDGCGCEI